MIRRATADQLNLFAEAPTGERTTWPQGHVIHMSLDHDDSAQSISVATCDCGWEHRVPWPGKAQQRLQDAAVELHWCEVEEGTKTGPRLT